MVDRLEGLLGHFSVSARTFQAGPLCGINTLDGSLPYGQLHLLRHGKAEVWHGATRAHRLDGPTLLFYPRPLAHRFVTDQEQGAEFVCAHIAFEGHAANPLGNALPGCVCLPLASLPDCVPVLTLLFAEAQASNCGRQAMLDRLFEVILIQLLRHLMEHGSTQAGLLTGLAHPQLRHALAAMHQAPAKAWSVESLASVAGMSRSVFANQFRDVVGETPAGYLQRWRIGLVQKWLKNGQPLRLIAEEAGYSSEPALSRAFKSQCGLSPKAWLAQEQQRSLEARL
ncbi:AraC family transcriptional regulator [Pseudomonas argentinensis]|uniref:AraC family transcriptional regulator n=1 Tax=Phytopseudomonas argentinensis TaxID=289370 RepID=UPI0008A8F883|nr:AraC family transcriptional regulator [Pseudomonas argentinensis]